ncbi:DNA repair protein RecO [Fusobacterium sp.]|uniref:DNA repair protein RecO n=1 Tax=Fusobacterium sp. TaxID=68766 RepID=UPI0025BB7C46|nr:DNA repair protein RecO [Fusobacterium sp.]
MIKFITDRGLVINKRDFGEADRYITVFTENFGKIVFLLKGIRKSKKRELNSIDTLSLSNFNFYKKGENYIVSSFTGMESYGNIKSDLNKLEISLYFVAWLNSILVENNRKKSLYKIVLKSLEFLNNNENKKKNYILMGYFLSYLIRDEGLNISNGEGYNFSFEKSKFITEDEKYILKVSKSEKSLVEKFINNRAKEIDDEIETLDDIKRVIFLFERYLNFHLGIDIKLKNYIMEG